jgi:hypothetical protein
VLTEVARAPWPLSSEPKLRTAGVLETAPGELVVYRYAVGG